ncbi:hypothetical protein CPB86DRAFT_623057 [Serendipita vermifera]|nr:hypothetical protein CPB86DRAFT_623057 [Serendipita vermifera]
MPFQKESVLCPQLEEIRIEDKLSFPDALWSPESGLLSYRDIIAKISSSRVSAGLSPLRCTWNGASLDLQAPVEAFLESIKQTTPSPLPEFRPSSMERDLIVKSIDKNKFEKKGTLRRLFNAPSIIPRFGGSSRKK